MKPRPLDLFSATDLRERRRLKKVAMGAPKGMRQRAWKRLSQKTTECLRRGA